MTRRGAPPRALAVPAFLPGTRPAGHFFRVIPKPSHAARARIVLALRAIRNIVYQRRRNTPEPLICPHRAARARITTKEPM
ncbi:hypothetical protein CBM2634_B160346 [Cupriavidus taiwanensis]|uniref:Uncharacterized protein n=1 Tax=Cupriavidus taiwanensis TaxID=164546 RepID=A0A375J8K7_9BURK|nr:hypothetical protein CBM2634_B160346 [Cupriavidus taiwanensis]